MAEGYRSLVYYRAMIEDRVRTEAYQRAIFQIVQPDQVILDLGTGMGILACFAAQAGAKRIYAVESTDIITLAQNVALMNHFDSIMFLPGWSTDIEIPERVDGIVTETLGGMALDENLLRFLNDARRRLLKPGGFLIPNRLRLFIAAVESAHAYDHVAFWDRMSYGIHFRPVAQRASKIPFVSPIQASELLSQPVVFQDINLYEETPEAFETIIEMTIMRSGYLHGWAGWFEADLASGNTLATGPADKRTHWEQVFFPNVVPMRVHPGEKLKLRIRSVAKDTSLLWNWELV